MKRRKSRGRALKRRYNMRPDVTTQIERIDALLAQAIAKADARGYTGMLGSKGGLFEEPHVKRLMARRDRLLKFVPKKAKRGRG